MHPQDCTKLEERHHQLYPTKSKVSDVATQSRTISEPEML
jgi:hypothetical protein